MNTGLINLFTSKLGSNQTPMVPIYCILIPRPFFRIPVLFYDQLGNGESSHCEDAPPDFWTPELFMDELDNLLKTLEIYNNFDLLGQSWGGKYFSLSIMSLFTEILFRDACWSICSNALTAWIEEACHCQFASIYETNRRGYYQPIESIPGWLRQNDTKA